MHAPVKPVTAAKETNALALDKPGQRDNARIPDDVKFHGSAKFLAREYRVTLERFPFPVHRAMPIGLHVYYDIVLNSSRRVSCRLAAVRFYFHGRAILLIDQLEF